MKRYMTPKTRAFKGGSVDDNPVEVMEGIRLDEYESTDGTPLDIMERIRQYEAEKEAGTLKTKTLQEVMQELGIEEDDETT